ncbi:MAG: aminomethyl transferase family protein, partial [Planctomycetes bacterium]|nr:aminomethyl transferase family protein [Planctomycetota bacterium]
MGCQITPLHSLFQEWGAEFMPQGDVLLPVRGPGVGAEYEAARDGIALFDGGDRGWIEITGPDTADFLQRLLSSDVSKLEWGNGQWSAMLDGKGHW